MVSNSGGPPGDHDEERAEQHPATSRDHGDANKSSQPADRDGGLGEPRERADDLADDVGHGTPNQQPATSGESGPRINLEGQVTADQIPLDVTVTQELGFSSQFGGSGGSDDFELDLHVPEIPKQLGEYAIESLIGAGGMGRVYKAEHVRMARVVALKTLSPERMRAQEAVQRFYSEVRAAARLLHPNIVTAFDAGEIDGSHYLAMEYVEGETFSQLVGRRGPLPVLEAVKWIRGAATGLSFAHAAGIVHRDVKPGNLMLALDGTVKVLDLGLATIRHDDLEQPSRRGFLVGTFQYIAPEQLENPDAVDSRADIYSLGATLFYLLAGRSPYAGEMLEQLRQHREGPIPDLFSVRRDVDLRLDHIFQRMMAKRPQDRYSSLAETLEDINAWMAAGGTPSWLAGIGPVFSSGDMPTASDAPSTTSNSHLAFGIDLGMTHIAAAISDPTGALEFVSAGGPQNPTLRAALSSHAGRLVYGEEAMQHRLDHPQALVHSAHLYLGQSRVDRRVMDRQCPPEVLLAMMLRQVRVTAWQRKGRPAVVALTVPACYDQLHRRSILHAAKIAGFHSIRLVDRGLAAGQSQLHPDLAAGPLPAAGDLQHWVVASLTGLGCEAMVLRHIGGRLETIATAGTWLAGALTWQRRLIDLVAEQCLRLHGIDPRQRLRDASRLQQACEKAIKDLLLREQIDVQFRAAGKTRTVPVSRAMLIAAGNGLITSLLEAVSQAIAKANITTDQVERILTIGSLTRLSHVRKALLDLLSRDDDHAAIEIIPVDRRALAQGAALVAAAELPGREGAARPPQAAATYDLGLLAYLPGKSQSSTFPVIPQGTALPARTGRRLNRNSSSADTRSLTIVESAGGIDHPWRSLGSQPLPELPPETPLEVIFEVNIDGLLTLRLRNGSTGETSRLPNFPAPLLSPEQLQSWTDWVEDIVLTQ
ncbi:protein kinase domain-containing protein [Planctomycetaceae bacterium SH139]